jgi:hypothetical protein
VRRLMPRLSGPLGAERALKIINEYVVRFLRSKLEIPGELLKAHMVEMTVWQSEAPPAPEREGGGRDEVLIDENTGGEGEDGSSDGGEEEEEGIDYHAELAESAPHGHSHDHHGHSHDA